MKRELSIAVTAGAEPREVAVTVDAGDGEGRFRVTIDGVEHVVDGRRIRPGTWSLVIAGRSVVVDLDRRRDRVVATTGATEVALDVEDARHKRLRAAARREVTAARGESIRAPIAGKVVKVLVAVGDAVTAGQSVLVLEAMKMENELVAERGGTVTAIHRAAGNSVVTGEVLVDIA
jgi:biotin carboxyl carrier protein